MLAMIGVLPAATTAAAADTEVAGVQGYRVTTIDWKACADDVQCATIEVPLDWSNPAGAKTHVGIAKRSATDPGSRIGTLLMNPGGPGDSGVRQVIAGSAFTESVNKRFDVVGFDPRGVNTAEQVRCDKALSEQAEESRHPKSQADFDRYVTLNRTLMVSCREYTGPLVDHVGNLDTVRDLDAIRAALGEKELNYVGYSYGSLIGQQYAERFPHRIRAMVNDANMDHSLNRTLDFMRTLTAPVEAHFLAFANWCDTTPACALHGKGTAKVYGELREKAKAGKLTYPGTNTPVDFYGITGQLTFNLGLPANWGYLAEDLKSFVDGKGAVRVAAEPIRDPGLPIWCSDWRFPIRDFAHYEALLGKLAKEFQNVQWAPQIDLLAPCVGDPLETTNPQRRLKIDGAPPLVMIGNVHDTATPYEWSKTAARQSGSHLITYEGWGHTVYGTAGPKSPCVNKAVDAYLIDLKVPENGLSCPALEQPGPA